MIVAPPVCWNVTFQAESSYVMVYDWKIVVRKTGYVLRHGRYTVRPNTTKSVRVCTNGYKDIQATARYSLPGRILIRIRRAL